MAVNFQNEYVMLPQDRADHINERHVERNMERGASKFYRFLTKVNDQRTFLIIILSLLVTH